MKNNFTILMLLCLLLVVALSTMITSSYAQEENTITSEQPKYITIQHAQSGSISKVNETTNFLELNDVSDVILFSDRPDRIVKTESTQEFLDRWYNTDTDTENNSFFSDPPNAALVIDDQQRQNVAIVDLFEPAYDYDANILVYNFNYLNNTSDKLPDEFGQSTMVIDVATFINIDNFG